MKKLISYFQSLPKKLGDWYWDKIGWKIKYTRESIKNLIRWFPIIWKDRDWDDSFIFDILKFKLQNQSKYIRSRDFYTRAKRDAEVMMTCVRLIEKVNDELYLTEYLDFSDTIIEFTPDKSKPNTKKVVFTTIGEKYDDYFKKYSRVYNQLKSGKLPIIYGQQKPWSELPKEIIALNISHHNHERARKLLFSLLEKNIERWWE